MVDPGTFARVNFVAMEATMSETSVGERKSHALIASDRVEGTEVRRLNGNKIGRIERVMIDKVSGNVAYAVLSFGGLLGFGEKHLPVPWGILKYDLSLGAYTVPLSDEDLAKAPSYAADKEFDWGDRSDEITIHAYYKARPYWGAY
jgi:sporulation protein YlmC with PRC-barrel domain